MRVLATFSSFNFHPFSDNLSTTKDAKVRKGKYFSITYLCGQKLFSTISILFLLLIIGCTQEADSHNISYDHKAYFSRDGKQLEPRFSLAVVKDKKSQARGLMFVKSLEPHQGMLFVFPDDKHRAFWMHNTFVSLDMLFLDKNRRVQGILKDVPILNDERRQLDDSIESRYVLELAAGVTADQGIEVGDVLVLES